MTHTPAYWAAIQSWGPAAWRFLHTVSFTVPQHPTAGEQAQYRAFFESLQHVLPCAYCRGHLTENYQQLPIDVSSTRACSEWVYALHNLVNEATKKPKPFPSYLEVVAQYLPPKAWGTLDLTPAERARLQQLSPPGSPAAPCGLVATIVVLAILTLVLGALFVWQLCKNNGSRKRQYFVSS